MSLLERVFVAVERATKLNFRRYRPDPVGRRLAWRMASLGVASLDEYVVMLESSSAEARTLASVLLVKTTEMFRDPAAFDALRKALPSLIESRRAEGATMLRAWVAACATGEEAASVAFCIAATVRSTEPPLDWRVIASDVDPSALEATAQARFPAVNAANVPHDLAALWLEEADGAVQVADEIRTRIVTAAHDVVADPRLVPREAVIASFDIVTCRNLFIYLDALTQVDVAHRLVKACAPGALLMLGTAERLPDALLATTELVVPGQPLYRVWPK